MAHGRGALLASQRRVWRGGGRWHTRGGTAVLFDAAAAWPGAITAVGCVWPLQRLFCRRVALPSAACTTESSDPPSCIHLLAPPLRVTCEASPCVDAARLACRRTCVCVLLCVVSHGFWTCGVRAYVCVCVRAAPFAAAAGGMRVVEQVRDAQGREVLCAVQWCVLTHATHTRVWSSRYRR
jgi:hypothetical protein